MTQSDDNPYRSSSAAAPAPVISVDKPRPVVITVLCLLAALVSLRAIYLIWSMLPITYYQQGFGWTLYFVASSVLGALCFIGFWRMRRWGPILYLCLTVAAF